MTSKKSSKKAYTTLEALVLLHSLDEVESNGGAASESDVSWCLEETSSSSESDTEITSQISPCKKKDCWKHWIPHFLKSHLLRYEAYRRTNYSNYCHYFSYCLLQYYFIYLYCKPALVSSGPAWDMTVDVLKAFIALIYICGAQGGKGEILVNRLGLCIFKETMCWNRLQKFLRFLHFDKKDTRNTCLQEKKFSLLSEVLEWFVSNCITYYKQGSDITVH